MFRTIDHSAATSSGTPSSRAGEETKDADQQGQSEFGAAQTDHPAEQANGGT